MRIKIIFKVKIGLWIDLTNTKRFYDRKTVFMIKSSILWFSELKTLECDILNPDYLIWVSTGQTFDFLLKPFLYSKNLFF